MNLEIKLDNAGRRFNKEWIFRKLDQDLDNSNSWLIQGGNGSGKSTLLKLIAGQLLPSEGSIKYFLNGEELPEEKIYQWVSICAPYLDLYEDLSLQETLRQHGNFKPFQKGLNEKKIIELTGLGKVKNKAIKYYSSGMKQRVKLALAIFSDSPLLLLDEPISNLDKKAIAWYQEMLREFQNDRLTMVCSNQQEEEYFSCTKSIDIEAYK